MYDNYIYLAKLNLSLFNNTTNMNEIFNSCKNLLNLDLSSFNTNNVTNMSKMFVNCKNLLNLDLSSFNTLNVTNMNGMFNNSINLSTPV